MLSKDVSIINQHNINFGVSVHKSKRVELSAEIEQLSLQLGTEFGRLFHHTGEKVNWSSVGFVNLFPP